MRPFEKEHSRNKTLTLSKESRLVVSLCVVGQLFVTQKVLCLPGFSIWATVLAFFASAFLADLVTALFHFGFDYVWPDDFPIMGPISVEFRQHHDRPMLDPSAVVSNLTRGAYMGLGIGIVAWFVADFSSGPWQYLISATALGVSLWGLFFHQIHSYTHMGKSVAPDEFNAAVERISLLPKREQRAEFVKLFERVGIPKYVRFLQRCRLFLRPEVHWRHHISFESDFSSLNGWSDPLTNLVFGPIARHRKAARGLNWAASAPRIESPTSADLAGLVS